MSTFQAAAPRQVWDVFAVGPGHRSICVGSVWATGEGDAIEQSELYCKRKRRLAQLELGTIKSWSAEPSGGNGR